MIYYYHHYHHHPGGSELHWISVCFLNWWQK